MEEKRPKQSDKLERKGEGSAAVNHVMKQIKTIYRGSNNQPIPYYKLICNPHDFMETVQNAMIVSFLLKENLISLATGEDGLPQITVNTSQVESSSEDSNQSICGLDVELCEVHSMELTFLLNIKLTIIFYFYRITFNVTTSRNRY